MVDATFVVVDSRTQVLDLDTDFGEYEIECPTCGHQFTIDTETTENVIWVFGHWKPQCPECGQI